MPVAEWVTEQGQLLLALLEEHQYLVLALAVGFEAVGLPLPISAEIVVVAMGFQIFRGEANPWAVMGTVVASATVGASVQYWIARGVGRPLLERYGRILRIRPSHLERLERWFARRDVPVVVIGRVVPAIRIIIPVVAGVARGDFRRFVPAVAAGITLWTLLYMGIGWGLRRDRGATGGHRAFRPDAGRHRGGWRRWIRRRFSWLSASAAGLPRSLPDPPHALASGSGGAAAESVR